MTADSRSCRASGSHRPSSQVVREALDAAVARAEAASPRRRWRALDAGCGRTSALRRFRRRIVRLVGADIHAPERAGPLPRRVRGRGPVRAVRGVRAGHVRRRAVDLHARALRRSRALRWRTSAPGSGPAARSSRPRSIGGTRSSRAYLGLPDRAPRRASSRGSRQRPPMPIRSSARATTLRSSAHRPRRRASATSRSRRSGIWHGRGAATGRRSCSAWPATC